MGNQIQFYYNKNIDFSDKLWYKLTKINYNCFKIKMFSIKRGIIDINSFFPRDEIISKDLTLNGCYIAAFNDYEDENYIDYDFDLGFNNIDETAEYDLINALSSEKQGVLAIVNSKEGINYKNKVNPLFDPKSNDFIEKRFQVIKKGNDQNDEYIIKISSFEEYKIINNKIGGYLIGQVGDLKFNLNTELNDINNLNILTQEYSIVVTRASIFHNHNLVLYSRRDFHQKINSALKSLFKSMEYLVLEVGNLDTSNNLMRW